LTKLYGFGAVALMMGSGMMVATTAPQVNVTEPPPGLEVHETHAAASLLGQFRTSVSGWLWLRTDLYLHNGVEMRMMTEHEKAIGLETHEAADDGHDPLHDESFVVTTVPPKERDFRGILGDIERATASYKDMRGHSHNDPKSALPLFRLMTWLDPHFIPGWTTGGTVLARERNDEGLQKALSYLGEGLRQNPNSIAILCEIARLHMSRSKNFEQAKNYLERARTASKQMSAERLAGQMEDVNQVYRWLALCYREMGLQDQSQATAAEGFRIFTDDRVLERLSGR
jgi:hypothetical protein